MMMISHDLSVLGATCDRVAVMYAGRVVEEGPADQVFAAPLHPYTARAVGGVPDASATRRRGSRPRGLPGDPPDPRDLPSGCTFHPRCPSRRRRCADDAEPALVAGEGRTARRRASWSARTTR